MTPAQRKEVQRFTQTMWHTLGAAEVGHDVPARTGRILARRGFMTLQSAQLTEAGREALALRRK